mmetsp:Transcript_55892/g.131012  ORF Transcript_55892/g.131012 Transcript_55892/m.131012 type:complete len:203 (+) Transcript_55892:1498-2106(+)
MNLTRPGPFGPEGPSSCLSAGRSMTRDCIVTSIPSSTRSSTSLPRSSKIAWLYMRACRRAPAESSIEPHVFSNRSILSARVPGGSSPANCSGRCPDLMSRQLTRSKSSPHVVDPASTWLASESRQLRSHSRGCGHEEGPTPGSPAPSPLFAGSTNEKDVCHSPSCFQAILRIPFATDKRMLWFRLSNKVVLSHPSSSLNSNM